MLKLARWADALGGLVAQHGLHGEPVGLAAVGGQAQPCVHMVDVHVVGQHEEALPLPVERLQREVVCRRRRVAVHHGLILGAR